MSADLKELRVRLTPEAKVLLTAHSRVTGREQSELVREIVQRWAEEQLHVFRVADGLLRAEGLSAAPEGSSGSERERHGAIGVRRPAGGR